MKYKHETVLLHEAVAGLAIDPEGIYVDATFGRGGHSREILKALGPNGKLIALDRDPEAVKFAETDPFFAADSRFVIVKSAFSEIEKVVAAQGCSGNLSGVLIDLGVSSPQLDEAARGFSFMREGDLDMRMDPNSGISAKDWLASAGVDDIADVIKRFGEEKLGKKIANAIALKREEQPINTTKQLADIVESVCKRRERHIHPATKTFQGIRIYINSELEEIKTLLDNIIKLLRVGGRLSVISFHSLEDRIVKRFMRDNARGIDHPKELPITVDMVNPRLKLYGRGLKASAQEIEANPRSRSAVLRIAEKIS